MIETFVRSFYPFFGMVYVYYSVSQKQCH